MVFPCLGAAEPRAATKDGNSMDFRRSGSAEERRRRVLRDEITGQAEEPAEGTPVPTSSKRSKRRYSDGALAENQPRVTDFLPQRGFSLLVWGLGLLTAIAALETIHISFGVRGWFETEPRLSAFNHARPGSLGQWLAGGMLAMAAALGLVTFRLRAHRIDDFRGKYRLWLVAIGALLLASIDVTTGVHHACSAAVETLAKGPFLGMREGWWMALYGGFFGIIGIRLAIEIRASRPALTFLFLSSAFFVVAGMLTAGIVSFKEPLEYSVALSTTWLVAVWGVLMSTASFARHVFLDAQGLLPIETGKTKKKSRRVKPKSTSSSDEEESEEAAEPPKKQEAAAATSKTPAVSATKDDDEEEEDGDSRLSKSERKRLKKMQQFTRRAA